MVAHFQCCSRSLCGRATLIKSRGCAALLCASLAWSCSDAQNFPSPNSITGKLWGCPRMRATDPAAPAADPDISFSTIFKKFTHTTCPFQKPRLAGSASAASFSPSIHFAHTSTRITILWCFTAGDFEPADDYFAHATEAQKHPK